MISSRVSLFPVVMVLSFASLQAGFTQCASVAGGMSSICPSVKFSSENGSLQNGMNVADVQKKPAVDYSITDEEVKYADRLVRVLRTMIEAFEGNSKNVDEILADASKELAFAKGLVLHPQVEWLRKCVAQNKKFLATLSCQKSQENAVDPSVGVQHS